MMHSVSFLLALAAINLTYITCRYSLEKISSLQAHAQHVFLPPSKRIDEDELEQTWHQFSMEELENYLDCHNSLRSIWNEQDWIDVRKAYLKQIGLSSFPVWDELSWMGPRSNVSSSSSLSTLLYADQTLDKGRGVFASRAIQKGELLYTGTNYAFFQDGESFRKFIMSVRKKSACDLMMWTWIQALGVNGTDVICIALDHGSQLNDGDKKSSNAKCGTGSDCKDDYYATRNIAAGEELLGHYSDFVSSNDWKKFGL